MNTTRRRFLAAMAAFGLAMCTAYARPSRTLLRCIPNPRSDHLSPAEALMMCDPEHVAAVSNGPPSLELAAYRTVAFDAVPVLASYEETWFSATFGIADLTESVARAITGFPCYFADFRHVEWITPAVAAVLLGGGFECITFKDVIAIDPEAVRDLATRLQDNPESELAEIRFQGDFHVDLELARALAALPIDVCLQPRSNEHAFAPGCAKALSRHVGRQLSFDAFFGGTPPPPEIRSPRTGVLAPEDIRFYSERFISELASNSSKRVKVWQPEAGYIFAGGSIYLSENS